MQERYIQQKIIKYAVDRRCVCAKIDASRVGWPDLTVVLPNGVVLFVEVKQPTGHLSDAQRRMQTRLKRNNAHAYTIRSVEEFADVLARHL